jgi:hypothetical protein
LLAWIAQAGGLAPAAHHQPGQGGKGDQGRPGVDPPPRLHGPAPAAATFPALRRWLHLPAFPPCQHI